MKKGQEKKGEEQYFFSCPYKIFRKHKRKNKEDKKEKTALINYKIVQK